MDKQNYELAEEDYINGMKYKEIAEKYNVSINTVKSWKTRCKWCKDKKGMHTKSKKVCTQSKKSAGVKKPIADEVKEVLESTELNEKHRLFAVIYSKRFNATKAYQQVYHCTYESAMVNGCLLLRNTKVKALVDELTAIEFNKEALKRGVLQKYIDIALSDIGDYLSFGKKQIGKWTKDKDGIDIPVIDPDTGEQKLIEYSYVDLKESISVDTSLITEISEGKDGIRIKLVDKTKALDFLSKHLNLLSDEEKTKLDIENKKLQALKLQADIEKTKAEINKMTGSDQEIEDTDELESEIYGD